MYASWANVLRNVPNAEQNLPEMHRTLSEQFIQYRQGKHVPLDWNNDRTTYNMATAVGVPEEFHSLTFGYTSMYVHPSASFFLGRIELSPKIEKLVVGVKSDDKSWNISLRISHDLMITALRLRARYSGSAKLLDDLKICERDFFTIWGYAPQSSVGA
jgi:hypothetical protein